jgi:hypothetical protein
VKGLRASCFRTVLGCAIRHRILTRGYSCAADFSRRVIGWAMATHLRTDPPSIFTNGLGSLFQADRQNSEVAGAIERTALVSNSLTRRYRASL